MSMPPNVAEWFHRADQLGRDGRVWLVDVLVDDAQARQLVELIKRGEISVMRVMHGGTSMLEVRRQGEPAEALD
jgi:hypothetical protein